MKKLMILIALTVNVLGGFSQESELDPQFASYMIETERRTVFVQNMNLTEADAKRFWPIFDEFEAELLSLRETGIKNLKSYGEQYEKMTDDQASILMKSMLKNEAMRTKIRKKYYNKFSKEMGGKVATRVMQLDAIVSMVLKLSIYDELPLVGDLN